MKDISSLKSSKKKLSFTLKKGWKLNDVTMMSVEGFAPHKNGKRNTVKKDSEITFHIQDPTGYSLWFHFFFE